MDDDTDRVKILRILAGESINVDETNEDGQSLLHRVTSPLMVNILLDAGANLDLADKDGNTPLIIAAKHGYLGVSRALLRAGASKTIHNKEGKSVFQVALDLHVNSTASLRERKFAISAMLKRTKDHLTQLDAIEIASSLSQMDEFGRCTLIITGEKDSGKSSLLTSFLNKPFNKKELVSFGGSLYENSINVHEDEKAWVEFEKQGKSELCRCIRPEMENRSNPQYVDQLPSDDEEKEKEEKLTQLELQMKKERREKTPQNAFEAAVERTLFTLENEKKALTDDSHQSQQHTHPQEFIQRAISKPSMRLQVMEFNGSSAFHTFQRRIMSPSSVYVVVFSMVNALHKTAGIREHAWSNLEHWLFSIHCAVVAGKGQVQPRVFVVGTHGDKINKLQQHTDISNAFAEIFKGKPYLKYIVRHSSAASTANIKKSIKKKMTDNRLWFWPVNNIARKKAKKGQHVYFASDDHEKLQNRILQCTLQEVPHARSPFPVRWAALYDDLNARPSSSSSGGETKGSFPFVHKKERIYELGRRYDLEEADVNDCVSFYKNANMLFEVPISENNGENLIITDVGMFFSLVPRVVRNLRCFHSYRDKQLTHKSKHALTDMKEKGKLSPTLIADLWEDLLEDDEQKTLLAEVLVAWRIISPIHEHEVVNEKSDDVEQNGSVHISLSTSAKVKFFVPSCAPFWLSVPPKKALKGVTEYMLSSFAASAMMIAGDSQYLVCPIDFSSKKCMELYVSFFLGSRTFAAPSGIVVIDDLVDHITKEPFLIYPEAIFNCVVAFFLHALYGKTGNTHEEPSISRTSARLHYVSEDIDNDREFFIALVPEIRGMKVSIEGADVGLECASAVMSLFQQAIVFAVNELCPNCTSTKPMIEIPTTTLQEGVGYDPMDHDVGQFEGGDYDNVDDESPLDSDKQTNGVVDDDDEDDEWGVANDAEDDEFPFFFDKLCFGDDEGRVWC
eukprot:m.94780 g.94780  ORF g.94780 m.94780 type:complete len:959 (-) comp8931_c1_seq1:1371-4247(-)